MILDEREFYIRMGEDSELLRILTNSFINEIPKQLIHLENLLNENNFKNSQALAHTIKGMSGNMSAMRMQNTALNIEFACKEENIDAAFDNFIKLKKEFKKFIVYAEQSILKN